MRDIPLLCPVSVFSFMHSLQWEGKILEYTTIFLKRIKNAKESRPNQNKSGALEENL